jgi:hypothetical protein
MREPAATYRNAADAASSYEVISKVFRKGFMYVMNLGIIEVLDDTGPLSSPRLMHVSEKYDY